MSEQPTARGFTLIVLLAGVLWFGLLGYRDLYDPDEGRYAAIPAGMVESGDWLTPRLNGFKYFEKPALQYWATAAVYTVLGRGNASARLFTALTGFAAALFAGFVARRLYGRNAAFHAFLVAASYLIMVAFGHYLTLDMAVSAFLFIGIGSLAVAQHDPPGDRWTRNWMLLGWAALALATLTKGVEGIVLPAGAVLAYSLWLRDFDLWKRLHLLKGLALYLLITVPWFIAVSAANPEFARFFFIHEHLERYLTTEHQREGPIWYFVPFLVLGACPWVVASLRALARPGFAWWPQRGAAFDGGRFLFAFVAVTFAFFSLGQSKLPGYILPIYPALAVLTGHALAGSERPVDDRWTLLILCLAMICLASVADQMASDRYPLHQWQTLSAWLYAGAGALLLAALCLSFLRRRPRLAWAAGALGALLAGQCALWGMSGLAETRSSRLLADAIARAVPAGTPVFSYLTFPESASFYLGEPITVVDYSGELAMGIESGAANYIGSFAEFARRWRSLDQAALVINVEIYADPAVQSLPGKVLYSGPKRMVIIRS